MSSGSPTDPAQLLSGTALTVFRLNGQLLEVSEKLARPVGLTAAWWQVLGAVVREPLPVAGIARIGPAHRAMAEKLAGHLGTEEFQRVLTALQTLADALDVITPD